MKKCLLCLLCATAWLYGEFLNKPDANTLWCENGKGIQGWSQGLTFTPLPDGGFTVSPDTKNDSGRYVPVDSANYPWMECEVIGVSHLGNYRQFSFHGYFGMTSKIFKGIYAFKYGKPGVSTEHLRFNLYGTKMDFKYIKLVKKPSCYIEASQVNDKIKVTVHLSKPAEDVSVRFFASYTMPQLKLGGETKLQLYPVDENNPIDWSAEVPAPEKPAAGGLIIQATILGGEVTVPVWGIL